MIASIEDAPTLYILIEILKEGRARSIQELGHLEPFDIQSLYTVLRNRTDLALPSNFEDWYDWFIGASSKASESDKEALRMIKSMHDRDRRFTKRPG